MITSGDKGIVGLQVSGPIFGRSDIVGCCALKALPDRNTVGQLTKVGEEEIGGLVVVVERVLGQSFDCKCAPWEERVETMPGFLRNRPRAKIRSVVDMRGEEHGPHPLPILRL